MIRVALAGNPNCGKTTLFNALTGSTAYVGNWPGVTVEKRSGTYYSKKDKKKANGFEIVDLPGIYSLSPYTPEEIISRDYVIKEKPDVVVAVIDGTNLERNLYLSTQILEMDVPVVLAVNMIDAVAENNQEIDYKALEKALGVPVMPISALRNKGLEELMNAVAKVAGNGRKGETKIGLEKGVEAAKKVYAEKGIENALFHAIKALEKDELEAKENPEAYEAVQAAVKGDNVDYESGIADGRYVYLTPLCEKAIKGRAKHEKNKLSLSDKVDKVLTNKWAAIPIMIVVLFLCFHFVFASDLLYLNAMGVSFGDGYEGFIKIMVGVNGEVEEFHPFAGLFWSDGGINSIGEFLHCLAGDNETGILGCFCLGVKQLLLMWGSPDWVIGFVYDGILNGVCAVLGFVPQIMLLLFFFSLLEDSGYMARISFVLDRIFHRLGVSGRAFLPMIMGFGCGVPAMMNTRTLASDKERTKTIRVIPFFTCGAKAEFLAMIAAAVAGAIGFNKDLFTFLIYMFGVIVAFIAISVMSKTTQREKTPPFIMELPPYHRPSLRALLLHVWDRGKHFIKKAFTLILLSTIIVWFLANFGWSTNDAGQTVFGMLEADTEGSILYYIGTGLSYLFVPLGFGSQLQAGAWTFSVASVEGIIAKENVTAVLETLAINVCGDGAGFEDLIAASGITPAGITAFAVFNMLTIPCFASVATAGGELKDKMTTFMTILFWLGVSYVAGAVTYVVFQWVWTVAIVVVALIGLGVALFFYDKHKSKIEAAQEAAEEAAKAA